MKIGKASYGGGNKKTYFKIKDGDNVYRIIPPIGDLADKGIWSVFHKVHYGYKNSAGKLRPFLSPLVKNYKTKMIEVPDAALERIESLKAKLAAAKEAGDNQMVAKLNEFVGPKGAFNLDNNHYVNAIDAQGNIGILKLRHRAKVALDACIKKLREQGIDPLSVENGRYFVISRSGTGLDTTFSVSVLTQKINVPGIGDVQKEVVHVLDEAIISRLATEAAKLDTLFKAPTAEQVKRIVLEGAAAVDEILDAKTNSNGAAAEDYDDSADYDDDSAASASSVPATTVASAPTSAPAQAAAPATTASVSSTVASTPAAPATALAAPMTTAGNVNQLSDADFLKSIGL
jgi:hypothetical protein